MKHGEIDPLDVIRALHRSPERRVEEVAEITGVAPEVMCSPDRSFRVCRARHYAMWLMDQDGITPAEIKRVLGITEHSTVSYGIAKIEQEIKDKGLSCQAQ